jgi:hypothetical protein
VPRDMEQDPSLAAGLSDEEAQLLAGCAKGRVTAVSEQILGLSQLC